MRKISKPGERVFTVRASSPPSWRRTISTRSREKRYFCSKKAAGSAQFNKADIPTPDRDRSSACSSICSITQWPRLKGEIKISTSYSPASGVVLLEVADDGCGLAPEVRARIFEPYFSTKKDGTGLGLAIVNAIVADHRGHIRVRPNEPKGTRFIIELPVRDHGTMRVTQKRAVS